MTRIYYTLILTLICIAAAAMKTTSRFTPFRTQSYTPYYNVNSIAEDENGILWIATENGLYHFNGYEYGQYIQNKDEANSLPNNNCRKLLVDSQERLWICTDNGLIIQNRETDGFNRIVDTALAITTFIDIQEDKDGSLWTATYFELIHLNPQGEIVEVFPAMGLRSFAVDQDCIWLGNDNDGLTRFNRESHTIEKVALYNKNKAHTLYHIQAILPTSDGKLFIGTDSQGLVIYDKKTSDCQIITSKTHPYYFENNNVLSLFEDSRHNVWIGSINGRIVEYNLKGKDFAHPIFHYPSGVKQLTVSCIYEDHEHNIWLGTHHYWLFLYNRNVDAFRLYQKLEGVERSLSHNAVTCFEEDNGMPIVGTDGGGINILDRSQKRAVFIKKPQFGNVILDIHKDSNSNKYWIATWGNDKHCLFCYDSKTNTTKTYDYNPSDKNGLTSNLLRDVLIDGPYVWVATDGGGICRLDTRTDKIDNRYNCKEEIFSLQTPQWTRHLMKDSKGRIWLCTSEGVICYNDGVTNQIPIEEITSERLQNEVRMSMEDSKGNIYFITANNGLFRLDEKSHTFINETKAYKLPLSLYAICEDGNQNLWVTSTNEMIRINTRDSSSYRFNMQSDLCGQSFSPAAIFRSGDFVYAGSNNGFFMVNVNKTLEVPSTPKVFLEHLYIKGIKQDINTSHVLNRMLAFTDTIILDHNENDFNIQYCCVDLDNVENVHYQYRMIGSEFYEWSDPVELRNTYFSNLKPGTYTFQVKATTVNATTDFYSKPLTIIIQEPWWNTLLFKFIISTILIAFVILLVILRERSIRKNNAKLESLIAQRTKELQCRNKEIQEQKEDLENQNKKLDDTIETKNRIMSVVAHDLRNPLTSIVGNLSLLKENEPENTIVKHVYKSAKILQSQMENLLDWARLQNDRIFYSPQDTSMNILTKECITLLQDNIQEKHLNLTYKNECHHNAYVDYRMVSTIIRNLLNNAIKFTYEGGEIAIVCTEDDNSIHWSIQDNGVGMTQEQCDKILNGKLSESTFGTNNEAGSCLGMKICVRLVEISKGTIHINSTLGKGAKFSLTFPKGKMETEEAESTLKIEEQTLDKERRQKLLLVDDNEEILLFLSELLKSTYDLKTANDGLTALDIAQKELPDLIVSDIIMPKMNGRRLCQLIKSDPLTQHIPVILLTSEDSEANQVEGLKTGADDYMTKPFNRAILKAKIETILHNKDLQRNFHRDLLLQKSEPELPPTINDQFIQTINEVIKKNIASNNLTVEFLASETALSRVQLFRKMKSITGCSPSEYIKVVRLDHAATLLKECGLSVSETAYAVGFSDPKYFSTCFTEKFGVSPSQWAKNENK